jgi:hypothetical protein
MSHWGNTYWPIWISVCSFLFLVPEVISQIFNHYNSLSEYAWRELGVSKAFQFTMHSAAYCLHNGVCYPANTHMVQGSMSAIDVQILVSAVTFIMSIAGSMFIAGNRWGRIESKIEIMADRLAKIEGMFTLRLKDRDDSL